MKIRKLETYQFARGGEYIVAFESQLVLSYKAALREKVWEPSISDISDAESSDKKSVLAETSRWELEDLEAICDGFVGLCNTY